MKKVAMAVMLCFMVSLLFTAAASAHVTIYPKQVKQGTYEKFTVRVPTEKEIPTVKLKVEFPPEGINISKVEAKPGWTYELTKDDTDKIIAITWTATGEGILADEFAEFYLNGNIDSEATGSLVWNAYQTYQDDSVVGWTSTEEKAQHPAPTTEIISADTSSSTEDRSDTSLYLSIGALLLAAIALILSFTSRKR